MGLIQKLLNGPGPDKHADSAHGYFTYPKLEGAIGNRMMLAEQKSWYGP